MWAQELVKASLAQASAKLSAQASVKASIPLSKEVVVSALAKATLWDKSDKEKGVLVSLTKMRDKSHPATLIRPSSLLLVSLCTVYFHYFCTLAIRSHLPHTVVSPIVASNKNTFIFSTFELSSFLSQREEGPVLIHTA